VADLYESVESVGDQAENILTAIAKFALPAGHLEDFEDAVSQLTPAASSNQLEDALMRLGEFLGFHSERPEQEYAIGPDVLWLPTAQSGIVIESKGGKEIHEGSWQGRAWSVASFRGMVQSELPGPKMYPGASSPQRSGNTCSDGREDLRHDLRRSWTPHISTSFFAFAGLSFEPEPQEPVDALSKAT
jgi:hypothetical protein